MKFLKDALDFIQTTLLYTFGRQSPRYTPSAQFLIVSDTSNSNYYLPNRKDSFSFLNSEADGNVGLCNAAACVSDNVAASALGRIDKVKKSFKLTVAAINFDEIAINCPFGEMDAEITDAYCAINPSVSRLRDVSVKTNGPFLWDFTSAEDPENFLGTSQFNENDTKSDESSSDSTDSEELSSDKQEGHRLLEDSDEITCATNNFFHEQVLVYDIECTPKKKKDFPWMVLETSKVARLNKSFGNPNSSNNRRNILVAHDDSDQFLSVWVDGHKTSLEGTRVEIDDQGSGCTTSACNGGYFAALVHSPNKNKAIIFSGGESAFDDLLFACPFGDQTPEVTVIRCGNQVKNVPLRLTERIGPIIDQDGVDELVDDVCGFPDDDVDNYAGIEITCAVK